MEKELKNHSTGNHIKSLEIANKLTHKRVSGKIRVSTRTLQMWESGKNLSFILKCQIGRFLWRINPLTFLTFLDPKGWVKIKKSLGDAKKSHNPGLWRTGIEDTKMILKEICFRCIDQMPDPFSGEKLSDFVMNG